METATVVTVCVLEPCCDNSAPWGEYPENCRHGRGARRAPVFTTHPTLEAAAPEAAKLKGWYHLDGYVFEGEMPPEGERFRIMPIIGSLNTHYEHAAPVEIPFPTIEQAREYAEDWHEWPDARRHKEILFNIVGDQDTRVRWSSYTVPVGTELAPGDWA